MDETMEEASSGPLTVRDVAELLHGRYAIITGGRTADNFPIITFPDLGTFCSLSDEDYKKLMLYLTSVPTMHEADLGFVLVVDRRNDKWSAVKTVLLKISGFFPGLIQEVFVLRPLGFFQKAISEVSNKFFKEEFKFKLVVCSNVEELHEHIEPTQLTPDLGGTVAYCHEDWIEQRVAVEKFSTNLQEISTALREMTRRLQETELPNDVDSTRCLLEDQGGEYRELKDDIRSAARHGETLLSCIRQPAAISSPLDLCPDRLINVSAVERLLVQLEETEKGFDYFWSDHEKRLSQCLELRKFEFDFKEHQANLASSLKELRKISEAGDSVGQVDCLLTQMQRFKLIIEVELARAETTCTTGKDLIAKNHYAVDSISPKCVELEELIDEMKVEVARKIDILSKYRDLQHRIEKANRWCAKGVDVLASQQIEKCTSSEFSEVALKELDEFLDSSKDFRLSDPREFHVIFKDVSMTPETRALVQQVLKRVEDVQMMCEQRRSSLQKLIAKPIRPIQAVVPEPAVPLLLSAPNGSGPNASSGGATTNSSSVGATTLPRSGKSPDAEKKQLIRKAKTVPKVNSSLFSNTP